MNKAAKSAALILTAGAVFLIAIPTRCSESGPRNGARVIQDPIKPESSVPQGQYPDTIESPRRIEELSAAVPAESATHVDADPVGRDQGKIDIQVLDNLGIPVPWAVVKLRGPAGEVFSEVQTERSGWCSLQLDSPPGGLAIEARAVGLSRETAPVGSRRSITIVLSPMVRLSIAVVDARTRQAVAGASVRFEFGLEDDRDLVVKSDRLGKTGQFELPCERPVMLTIHADGYAVHRSRYEASCASGEAIEEIQLESATPLAIRVEDGVTLLPIEGAVVSSGGVKLESDPNGLVHCSLPLSREGKPRGVEVRAPGYCFVVIKVSNELWSDSQPLRVPLFASCRLVCTLTGIDGEPLAGHDAQVSIDLDMAAAYRAQGAYPDQVATPGWPEFAVWDPVSTRRQFIADENGSFVVENLPPGLPSGAVRVVSGGVDRILWELGSCRVPGQSVKANVQLGSEDKGH